MSTQEISRSSIAWKYYLLFLWIVAVIFLGVIIYGLIVVQVRANESPASGLAIGGIFSLLIALTLYCGFILLNTYIRKKIGHNNKASWRFLGISWLVILVAVVLCIFTMIQDAIAQDYYEKNVLPKEQACYEEYLNGSRTKPYCD